MKIRNDLRQAILSGMQHVLDFGQEVEADNWQGVKAPRPMLESIDFGFRAPMPDNLDLATKLIRPNLPWATDHFSERVGGRPLNPPPSHLNWPFAKRDNKEFRKGEIFDHTYPERFWPKFANSRTPFDQSGKTPNHGIRFEYGDLEDVIAKLDADPSTRQAYFPIWFPEDTGKSPEIRVPCTLGYHFMIRNNRLDIKYIMRSTDMLRHFQDDIFMCWLLADQVNKNLGSKYKLGYMTFLTFSAHVFKGEHQILKNKIDKLCVEF